MKPILPTRVKSNASFLNNQDGYVLPFVLIMMILIFTVSTALLSAITISLNESRSYLTYQKAVLCGKNTIEICKAELGADPDYTGTGGWKVQDDGSMRMIQIQNVSETKRFIIIKTISDDYGRYYEGEAEIDPSDGRIVKWSLRLKRWNGTGD